jgi:MinD-like ATPase involved in chromosome partitioning or flagellar assembly
MRVLIALWGNDGDRIHGEALTEDHDVVRLDHGEGSESLALRIRRERWDIVVVDAHADTLSMDVVDACDSRGVLLVAVVGDRQGSANASVCGVDELVSVWQSWSDAVHVARAGAKNSEPNSILQQNELRQRPLRILPDRHSPETSEPQGSVAHITESGSREARVVTVWGPTGAPGRTTVAVNLAVAALSRGDRVILIDADTYGGAVAIRCGVFDEAPGIARACRLAGSGNLTAEELTSLAHEVSVEGNSLHVVTGILSPARWPEISRERLEKVLDCARACYHTVIVDVGFSLETDEEVSSDMLAPRRNAATLAALRASTDIVAVSAADSVGLARFIRLWSDVCDANPDARISVAVNRVVALKNGFSATENIASSFSRFAGIRDVVLIPEATELVARADARGVPAFTIDTHSRFAAGIKELAHRAVGIEREGDRIGLREKMRGLRLLG